MIFNKNECEYIQSNWLIKFMRGQTLDYQLINNRDLTKTEVECEILSKKIPKIVK